jgi:hypothetical protein
VLDPSDPSFVLFLNDIRVSFSPANGGLTLDPPGQPVTSPNAFFLNVPGDLFADGVPLDDSYTGPIFEVFAAPATPAGAYAGTINILGGNAGPDDTNVLATQSFQIVVSPEPGVLGLTLAGLLLLALLVPAARVRYAKLV